MSICRVKFHTRYSNQLYQPDSQGGFSTTSLTRQARPEPLSASYSTWSTDQFGTDPPQPNGWGVLGIQRLPNSIVITSLEENQLGTGCIKGQPWCSVVSTGEPCINPVSPTRLRPAPLYGDLHPSLVLDFILLLYRKLQLEKCCSSGDFYVLTTSLFYQAEHFVLLYFIE